MEELEDQRTKDLNLLQNRISAFFDELGRYAEDITGEIMGSSDKLGLEARQKLQEISVSSQSALATVQNRLKSLANPVDMARRKLDQAKLFIPRFEKTLDDGVTESARACGYY